MAFIALLSAREGPGAAAGGMPIEFGGQPLVEFQARMAIAAGAEHILIQSEPGSPELSQLVDRLTAERQVSVALARDMLAISRSLAPTDVILVMAENMLIPAEVIASLAEQKAPALIALPPVPATNDFERIDADAMWAGALLLTGEAVLGTLDMLGEWDLGLTLLRRAVQLDAQRVFLSPELVMDGRLGWLRDQRGADAALEVLAERDQALASRESGGLRRLLAPVARPLVRELVRRQIEPAALTAIALLAGAVGLALGFSGFSVPAVLFGLFALGACDIAGQCAQITLRPAASSMRRHAVDGLALATLALIGWQLADGKILALSGAWLPLLLSAMISLVPEREDAAIGLWTRWIQISISIALVVVLAGLVLGMGDIAFALLGLLAFTVVALRLVPKRPRV